MRVRPAACAVTGVCPEEQCGALRWSFVAGRRHLLRSHVTKGRHFVHCGADFVERTRCNDFGADAEIAELAQGVRGRDSRSQHEIGFQREDGLRLGLHSAAHARDIFRSRAKWRHRRQ